MAKVAFLGLGVMGYPMAGHLKNKGGHEVTVYNRTAEKAKAWAETSWPLALRCLAIGPPITPSPMNAVFMSGYLQSSRPRSLGARPYHPLLRGHHPSFE